MRHWGFVGLACLSIGGNAFAADSTQVQIESGLLQGVQENGVLAFKGIPFAAAPTGDLRWRAPQPPTPWSGVRQADRFGPACMQDWTQAYPPGSPPEPVSEDCLYLNLWKPLHPPTGKLPVMVWIYGGGLENGSGAAPLYEGDRLASRNVIFVTFNYRLGAFGFLAHPALSQESGHGASGNYGLLDQIAALRWVQHNIAAWGGDPDRVTIAGQSSGGDSVSALVTSPLAAGLFAHAIGQSGGLFEPMALRAELTLAGAEQAGTHFMQRAGAASLADLRKKSAAEILLTSYYPQIIVDGFVVPRAPYDTYRQGKQNDVDLLLGSNEDEANFFDIPRTITAANFTQSLDDDGFPGMLQWLLGVKPGATDQTARQAALRFETDMRFGWDMWVWAKLGAAGGKRRVFYYRFAHAPALAPGQQFFGLGALHGMEMPYVFDHLDQLQAAYTAQDRRLASVIPAYWTNFVASGDPNAPGLPPWPAFTASRHQLMRFGDDIAPALPPREADLERIDRVYRVGRLVIGHAYALSAAAVIVVISVMAGIAIVLRRVLRWRRRMA